MPNSKVFRSRKGAIWWSFWVIVGAVTTVGFADSPDSPPGNATVVASTDAMGQPVSDADMKALSTAINSM